MSSHPSSRYVDAFYGLRCHPEVLRAVEPLNQSSKEISEAMAMVQAIKPHILENRGHVTLLDLCAGNALTSIIAAHLLPIREAIAVDRQPITRAAHARVRGFSYLEADLSSAGFIASLRQRIAGPLVVSAVHPCADLAALSIEVAEQLGAEFVAVMPCCNGTMSAAPSFLLERCSPYQQFSTYLSYRYGLRAREDKDVLSPKNVILSGKPGAERRSVLKLPKRRG